MYIYIPIYKICVCAGMGWRRCIGSLELQVSFRKRAINYRAHLRKMTYSDKASYASPPPCTSDSHIRCRRMKLQHPTTHCNALQHAATHTHIHTHARAYTNTRTYTYLYAHIHMQYLYARIYMHMYAYMRVYKYGVATISRLLKNISLFCRE